MLQCYTEFQCYVSLVILENSAMALLPTHMLRLSIWGLLPKSERFQQKVQVMLGVTLAYTSSDRKK
jgi:hypothetical protein